MLVLPRNPVGLSTLMAYTCQIGGLLRDVLKLTFSKISMIKIADKFPPENFRSVILACYDGRKEKNSFYCFRFGFGIPEQ